MNTHGQTCSQEKCKFCTYELAKYVQRAKQGFAANFHAQNV